MVDRRACFPFVVPEAEEIATHLEFVFDVGDLVVGDSAWDLVETLLCEEALVPEWALGIFGAQMEGRQQRIYKASAILVLDIDDCMLLLEEGW